MNAEDFYEEFKSALGYLGLSWGNKHLASVCVQDGRVCIAYKGKTVMFEL